MKQHSPWMLTTAAALLITGTVGCVAYGQDAVSEKQKAPAKADVDAAPVNIEKIYFMFHPVCWRMHGPTPPAGYDKRNWTACYNRELRVNEQQKELIRRMKPDEALVLFPIGTSPAMRELEEHATKTLGRRAIIVRRGGKDPPAAWAKLERPIERFLNDPKLEGREEFLRDVPPDIQAELEAEIRDAARAIGSDWNTAVLEVVYFSRLAAMDIQKEFRERRLRYDPASVRSEAFGEGFEQCAMTWKQMLVPYLGLAHPPENIFELSVSGAPFLDGAKLRERVSLSDDIRLYLWEGTNGRSIAMYARSWCRLKDPQRFAHVPTAGMRLEVREVHDKQCWPKPDAPELALAVADGRLKVPVFNGIRRDFNWRTSVGTDEEACYLIADGISFDQFRRRLVGAEIPE